MGKGAASFASTLTCVPVAPPHVVRLSGQFSLHGRLGRLDAWVNLTAWKEPEMIMVEIGLCSYMFHYGLLLILCSPKRGGVMWTNAVSKQPKLFSRTVPCPSAGKQKCQIFGLPDSGVSWLMAYVAQGSLVCSSA